MSTTPTLGDSFSIDSSENSYAPGIAVCRESASGGAINNQEIQDGTEVTISIAGSGAQPGDVLRVFIDDVLVAEHVLDASEISNSGGTTTGTGIAKVTISADVLKALAQGGHIVTSQIAYSDNTLSSVSPAKGTLNIDTVGPDAPIAPTATDDVGQTVGVIPEAATTDDANPMFSGTIAAKYNTIEVFDNGVSLGRATVNSITGKWTLTPTTALTDGPHAITVVEYDRAGNPSPTSAAMNFTVDTGPANVAITKVTDNVGDIQTDVATGGVTDDTTPTLVGTAKANTVVTISEGTTVLGTTTADALGHWTFTPATSQNEGAHTYSASITVAGNTTTSTNFVVTVDTTGPAVVVTPLGDNLKTAAEATAATGVITVNSEVNSVSTVTFVGQNGQVVKVITNNGTAKPVVLTATDLTTLGDGAVEVTTVTKDKAGNVTTTTDGADGDFTLDTVAAVAVADAVNTTEDVISTTGNVGTNDTSKDGSETYSLIGSATGVYGTLSLGSNGAYTYTRTANLDAIQITATDTFTYQVRDAAGNTTLSTLKINMAPVNDAAVIGGVNTGSINESNAAQAVTGTLTIMDVDSSATFVVQTNVTGTNGYGKFNLNSAGVWTYTMNTAHDEFVAGVNYTDSFTASSADGTTKLVTVTMKGTNDQPTFTSTAAIALSGTEDTAYNFVISNSLVGKVTDLDAGASVKGIAISWNQAPIDQGVWEWSTDGTTWAAVPADITGVATTFNNPANALYLNASDRLRFTPTANWNGNVNALVFRVADDTMPATVSGTRLNVSSYNGSTGPMSLSPSSYTLNVSGVNDAPVIVTTANNITTSEDTATTFVIATQLTGKVTDVDGTALKGIVIVQNTTTSGTWAYSTDGGTTWVDFPTTYLGSVDWTKVMYLNATDSLRYTPAANTSGANLSDLNFRAVDASFPNTASGTQVSVISSIGGSGAVSGQAGHFTVSVTAVNDAPIGTNDTASATEASGVSNATAGANPSGNVLTNDTDADNATSTLVIKDILKGTTGTATAVAASTTSANGTSIVGTYGTLVIGADGSYTYSVNQSNATVQALNTTSAPLSDVFTYTVKDPSGLTGKATITVSVNGANDAAVIGGVSTATLTETNAAQTATGTLTITDVDSAATFVAQSNVVGSNGYGKFSVTAAGAWTYTMNTAHDEFMPGASNTDSLTVVSADGTAKVITVTLLGTNDAPVLTHTTLTIPAVLQNSAVPTGAVGSLVASLVGGVSDVDDGAHAGIAITGVSNGTLYFSTNGGTNWTAVTSASNTNALVLAADADNRIYFKPTTGYFGTAANAITFRAWDTTSGAEGSYVSAASNGGTTAFSSATDTISEQVVRPVAINTVSGDNVVIMNEAVPLTGTADAGATVTLNINGVTRTVVADASGNWSYNAKLVPEVRYIMVRDLLDGSGPYTGTGVFAIDELNVVVNGSSVSAGKSAIYGVGTTVLGSTAAITEASATNYYETGAVGEVWVQLDLGGYYRADSITVTPRASWSDRVNGAKIYTAVTDMSVLTSAQLDAAAALPTPTVRSTLITGATAAGITYTQPNSSDEDIFINGVNSITASELVSGVSHTTSTTVTWTNPPVVAPSKFVTSYTEQSAAVVVNAGLTVVDVNSANITSATVSIGTGFTAGDTLAFTNANGITGSYNSATGVMSLSGAATVAKYQAALQSITFSSNSNTPTSISATRTINWQVNDGQAANNLSNVDTSTISVIAVNDAAVIGGVSTASLTETNVAQIATGTLTITDVDSAATFAAQTNTAGSNGYGKFSLTTAGAWTYTMNTAHDEFVAGTAYTDSFTAVSADGTTKLVTVTINGTNDAAVVTPNATARSYTENAAAIIANNNLTLVDAENANLVGATVQITSGLTAGDTLAFTAGSGITGTYDAATGKLSLSGSATVLQYQTALQSVVYSSTSDNPTASSASRTLTWQVNDGASANNLSNLGSSTINVVAVNDAAVIGGTTTASLTETNVAQTASGTLTITDVDSAATFVAQTNVSGSNGYGKFSVTSAGVWTYTMNTAHDEFLVGQVYTDSITVASADGTTKLVTVSITGSNHAPTLSYVDTGISNTDAITNNPAMSVSSLEAAATWEYQVDNGAWTVGTGTAFTMSEGLHTYNVRQKDVLNHVSASASKTVTLDTVSPNAAGIALASDAGVSNTDGVTNNGTLNIALSSDTNNWQYTTNGGTTWSNGTGATLGLAAGTYAANNVQVQAFDKAGNATLSKYASAVTVDTTAPTVSVAIGNSALQFGQSTTVSFNFSEAVYGFTNGDVSVSGGSLSNITGSGKSYSATYTAGYSYNGGSYVSVNANTYTDQAGNNGGSSSTGSFRVGINVADVARGMSLYVTGYGHGWCDTQGWIGVGLWGNNDLQGATVTLYDGWGHSWSSNVAGSGGSTNFGTFSGGGNNLTKFHADISYGGQTASVGGGVAYEVTWRGLVGLGFFNCIKGDTAYTFCYSSPIVLDLNGDGVQTVDTAHGVQFDMSGDGHTQSVGWVDKHDALLVRDINHDGKINNGTELFGSDTVLKNGQKAGDGWAALADMDSNADGKVDAQDAAFADIQVWVDANSDGVTDAGELRGLIDAGIQSIDVTHANSNTTQNGNVLFGTGQFTKADGTTAALTDAWFEVGRTLALDFTQVKGQALDMSDGQAQTVTLDFKELMDYTQVNGALQLSGDAADVVKIVNGGAAVTANRQEINGQVFSAYDLNSDGMNDLLLAQAMNQAQLF